MSKLEWAEKNLNQFKWALMSSTFNKIFTSDAHQCKTSHVTIVKVAQKISKKKKKKFLWPNFIRLLNHALWRPSLYSQVLYQMKDFLKLHNPGKFLEGSSFGSDFRDLQKLV